MKHQKTTNSKFKLKKYFTGTDGIKDENNAKFKTGAAISNSMITALPSIINDVRNDSVSNNYNINQNGLTPLEEKKNIGGMALKYGVSGASMGSAAGPWGAAIGGAVGAIGGASYGLISNNKIEKKNTILQNVNKIKTEALKQQNTDIEQIGYAKKGLDLTKYKKYDDGTDGIKTKPKPKPPVVNKAKGNIYTNPSQLTQTEDAKEYYKNVQQVAYKSVKGELVKEGENHLFDGKGKGAYDQTRIEKDPNSKNYGKVVKNNTCVSYACHIAKESGAKETPVEYNPTFTKNHEQLGWDRIPLDSAKTGDRIQFWDNDNTKGKKINDLGNNTYIPNKYPKHMGIYMDKNANGETRTYEDGDSQRSAKVANRTINKDTATAYRYVGKPSNNNTSIQKNMSIVKPKPIYKDKQPRAMIYKKGTKAVEVEGDEILMAKDKGKFKLKQDFKGGPTHEQGGIPIIAEEGDIIYPANKRKQVVEAVEDNNHKKLESIRKTLPSDTKYKKYNGDNGVGLGYKSKSKYKINTSKLGISASDYAERPPNVISSFDNYKSEKLDLGGDGAGDGTTPAALQGLTSKLSAGKKDPVSSSGKFGNTLSTAGEIAPLAYNIARGFEKPEKTVRRNIKPELLNYSDVSDPARNQAKNMYNDETNSIRNMTGGNAGAYLANQSLSKSRQYERMNEINNNEAARKMDITAKNIDLKNNAQVSNLNLDNQYDDSDLKNKATRNDMMATAMGNLSDYSQKKTKAANEEKSDNIKIAFTGQMYKDFELDTDKDGVVKYKDGLPQMRHKTEKKRMGTKSINTKYKVKC